MFEFQKLRVKMSEHDGFEASLDLVWPTNNFATNFIDKRTESSQSFFELRKTDLELLKIQINSTIHELQSVDGSDKINGTKILTGKVSGIRELETKVTALELKCQAINKERQKAVFDVAQERAAILSNIDELILIEEKVERRRLVEELIYEIATPPEMFNFQKIEDFLAAHQCAIERLERAKINATPEQIEIINHQMAQLEVELNVKLDEINFQHDSSGRKYYYDRNGVKRYLNEFRIAKDELGNFYVDESNRKI